MKKGIVGATSVLLAAAAIMEACAADPKIVSYFAETCGVCHGEKGEGTPGLAPVLKGSKFVLDSSEADVGETITKGRDGGAKRYKEIPGPMPAQTMSEGRLKALVGYLKNELQK
jgi:mono/diheme cytochrome c family protein